MVESVRAASTEGKRHGWQFFGGHSFMPQKRRARETRKQMPSPFSTTRRRLIGVNLLVVAAILAIMSIAVYAFDTYTVDQQVNQQLHGSAMHESPDLLTKVHQSEVNDHDPLYNPTSPNVFTVTLNVQGQVVEDEDNVARYGLPDVAAARAVLSGQKPNSYVTTQRGAHDYRLYTMPIYDHGHIAYALQAGTSLDLRDQQLHALMVTLLLVGIGVLLLTGFSSAFLTGRALIPARLAFARQRQFAAAASHELRTPLALVRSQAELVAGEIRDVEERMGKPLTTQAGKASDAGEMGQGVSVAADVEEILTEVDYMNRMVNDLLVLARDERDHRGLAWERLNLRAVAAAAAEKVQLLAETHGLRLLTDETEGDATREPIYVMGDADRLRQLTFVLLENATCYTPPGGTIRVAVHMAPRPRLLGSHGAHALLSVSDTGGGIAADQIPYIFEPFYRATTSQGQKDESSGTGLGLAVASWIAHAHHGAISVKSEPGAGSTFMVTLPLATDQN